MNSKRQRDLFGHTASYINTSLQRLAISSVCLLLFKLFEEYNLLWRKRIFSRCQLDICPKMCYILFENIISNSRLGIRPSSHIQKVLSFFCFRKKSSVGNISNCQREQKSLFNHQLFRHIFLHKAIAMYTKMVYNILAENYTPFERRSYINEQICLC